MGMSIIGIGSKALGSGFRANLTANCGISNIESAAGGSKEGIVVDFIAKDLNELKT